MGAKWKLNDDDDNENNNNNNNQNYHPGDHKHLV